ncbi:MAG: PGF-pre-PGF domain-containing protein [archaeon]
MGTKRTLTLVVALAIAGALTLPSAASPLLAGPTDQLGSDLALAPASDYASLDDNDELIVDLTRANPEVEGEGVNEDGRTSISDVFRIRYNGSQYAHVWLTHDAEGVTFAVDGEPIEAEEDNVTLAPNESVGVSLTVDTTGEPVDGLVDDIAVHGRVADAEEAADKEGQFGGYLKRTRAPSEDIRRFTVLSSEPGETISFDAEGLVLDEIDGQQLTFEELSVTSPNRSFSVTADSSGVGDAEAAVDDTGATPLGAVSMTVNSGNVSGATLQFSVTGSYFEGRDVDPEHLTVYRHAAGALSELQVTRTGESDERIRFEAETPGFSTFVVAAQQPRFERTDVSLDATTVAPEEPVTVNASVSNTGTRAGERTVTVAVNGTEVAERTITVPAGETETVTVPIVRNVTGEYTVSVNGDDVGAFRVASDTNTTAQTESTASASPEPRTQEPIDEPGAFGLWSILGLLVMLTLIAATLALARRAPGP